MSPQFASIDFRSGFHPIGYVTLALKLADHVETPVGAVEALSTKIGFVLVVLGAMHFLNLYVFSRIRRHAAIKNAPRPVPPDGQLPEPAGNGGT